MKDRITKPVRGRDAKSKNVSKLGANGGNDHFMIMTITSTSYTCSQLFSTSDGFDATSNDTYHLFLNPKFSHLNYINNHHINNPIVQD